MQITKEIYEKVVDICEGDYDLAHEVVIRLYDLPNIACPIEVAILTVLDDIIKVRQEEPVFVSIDSNDEYDIIKIMSNNKMNTLFEDIEDREYVKNLLDHGISKDRSAKDVSIVIEHFINGKTYVQLGKEYHRSHERMRQRSQKGLRFLVCEVHRGYR